MKALCFRHKQLLILPGEPGSRLARARVRGGVYAVRLVGNDQKRTEALLPVLAPVHGSLRLRRRDVGEAARDAVDVVADVASARARRFRGGVRGARTPLQVCKSRFGGYAWAGARQGAFAHDFATSTASSSAFDALNTFGAIPRGARRAMDSEVGGRRDPTPKTARERAQNPRRGARDGDGGARALAAIYLTEHELPN